MSASTNRKPKILLISYYFPPSPAVGGLRIAKFAKHLRSFDWDTQVLALDPTHMNSLDMKRLEEVRNIPIHRARTLPTLSDAYLLLKSILQKWMKTEDGAGQGNLGTPCRDQTKASECRSESAREIIRSYIFSLFVNLPDNERNWVIPAVFAALQLHKRERYDAILTSCPPFSVHLVGLLVERLTGVKWIADFRDPWMTGSKKTIYYTTEISNRIERWMERKVLQHAALVYANTARLKSLFNREHPALVAGKVYHVPNGYDETLFTEIRDLPKSPNFTLSYTGSIYFGRSPEPVFKALAAIIADDSAIKDRIRVRLVGHCDVTDGRSTRWLAETCGVSEIVEIEPLVSYRKSLEIVAQSHLALLFAPNQPFQIPAKVYDYFGCGTQILAIANTGETADLIRTTRSGGVFAPDNVDGIKAFLRQCLESRSKHSVVNPAIERFEIRAIVKDMAHAMKRLRSDA